MPPKPNLAFGYEVSTGTHAFQIYMASTTSLLPQDNIMWNQNKMDKTAFRNRICYYQTMGLLSLSGLFQ